jgi:hypothetical protein
MRLVTVRNAREHLSQLPGGGESRIATAAATLKMS